MRFRDRIKELKRVRASELRPNPKNWRRHPEAQHNALRSVLADVGYADAVLARELDDGSLMLIDGHLRAEIAPDSELPVLVLDVDAAEADKLLATHDTLATMAEVDRAKLAELLRTVDTDCEELAGVLNEMASIEELTPAQGLPEDHCEIPELFQLVVECDSESQQRDIYQRLTAEGLECRVLTL